MIDASDGHTSSYTEKNLSKLNKDHLIYPYLLRDVKITETNQVWSTDITYLPIYEGYAYLVAVIDWFSKFVLSWELYSTQIKGASLRVMHLSRVLLAIKIS